MVNMYSMGSGMYGNSVNKFQQLKRTYGYYGDNNDSTKYYNYYKYPVVPRQAPEENENSFIRFLKKLFK
jgi:signal peptidase I